MVVVVVVVQMVVVVMVVVVVVLVVKVVFLIVVLVMLVVVLVVMAVTLASIRHISQSTVCSDTGPDLNVLLNNKYFNCLIVVLLCVVKASTIV